MILSGIFNNKKNLIACNLDFPVFFFWKIQKKYFTFTWFLLPLLCQMCDRRPYVDMSCPLGAVTLGAEGGAGRLLSSAVGGGPERSNSRPRNSKPNTFHDVCFYHRKSGSRVRKNRLGPTPVKTKFVNNGHLRDDLHFPRRFGGRDLRIKIMGIRGLSHHGSNTASVQLVQDGISHGCLSIGRGASGC